jgi:hypothetical protein
MATIAFHPAPTWTCREASLPDKLAEGLLPAGLLPAGLLPAGLLLAGLLLVGLFPKDVLLLGVLGELLPIKLLPIEPLVEDGAMSGVERALGDGSLLETRSAGQVPQSPLKKPQGLPRKHCQWPAEFVQVRMPTQLGSAIGSLEGVLELTEPGAYMRIL